MLASQSSIFIFGPDGTYQRIEGTQRVTTKRARGSPLNGPDLSGSSAKSCALNGCRKRRDTKRKKKRAIHKNMSPHKARMRHTTSPPPGAAQWRRWQRRRPKRRRRRPRSPPDKAPPNHRQEDALAPPQVDTWCTHGIGTVTRGTWEFTARRAHVGSNFAVHS